MNPLFPCDILMVGMIFWSSASNC